MLFPIGARTASGQEYGLVDVREVRDDGKTDWYGIPDERRAALEAQVRRATEYGWASVFPGSVPIAA